MMRFSVGSTLGFLSLLVVSCAPARPPAFAGNLPPPLPTMGPAVRPELVRLGTGILSTSKSALDGDNHFFRLDLPLTAAPPGCKLGDVRSPEARISPEDYQALACGWRTVFSGPPQSAFCSPTQDRATEREKSRSKIERAIDSLAEQAAAAGIDLVDDIQCFVQPPALWCEGVARVSVSQRNACGKTARR